MKKLLLYLAIISLYSCTAKSEFKDDADFKNWLSGKQFTSVSKDDTHYYMDGSQGFPEFPLVIEFDGSKVKYNDCGIFTYSFYSKSEYEYVVYFTPSDCNKSEEVQLWINVKEDSYYVKSPTYNSDREVLSGGSAIGKLDVLAKNVYTMGPSMKITKEDIKIAGSAVQIQKLGDPVDEVDSVKYRPKPLDVELEIRNIRQKFSKVQQMNLKLDTLVEDDSSTLNIFFLDKNNGVVKIKTGYQGASIMNFTDYYFRDNKLYFAFNYSEGSKQSYKEDRKYIVNDVVVRELRDAEAFNCVEECYFGSDSEPYRLLAKYLSFKNITK